MPEHAWPDGSSGGAGGGGIPNVWEIVYSQDIPGGGPFPINTGIFYDSNYEYVVGGPGLPGQAKTGGEFVRIKIASAHQSTAQLQTFMAYSPNGGVIATLVGNAFWFKEGGTPDATMGVQTYVAVPTVDFNNATGEWVITGNGGSGTPGYVVIARRRVVA